MIIREAKQEDLQGVLDLYPYLSPDDIGIPQASSALDAMWAEILRDPKIHLIVCEADGALTATCIVTIIPNLTRNLRRYALVENVVADPHHRRKGYASAVMERAKQIAIENDCYKIMLSTSSKEDAILRFYESIGYNQKDKTAFVQWLGDR